MQEKERILREKRKAELEAGPRKEEETKAFTRKSTASKTSGKACSDESPTRMNKIQGLVEEEEADEWNLSSRRSEPMIFGKLDNMKRASPHIDYQRGISGGRKASVVTGSLQGLN